MSRQYSLRSLEALSKQLAERDRGLVLLLSRVSSQLTLVATQQAQLLAALNLPPESPPPVELAPLDVGEVVVLADDELRSIIDLAA